MAKTPFDGRKDDTQNHLLSEGADDAEPTPTTEAQRRGAKHALLPPSAEALRRAAPLFAQLVGLGEQPKAVRSRIGRTTPEPEGPVGSGSEGTVPARHYPLAARLLGGGSGSASGDRQASTPPILTRAATQGADPAKGGTLRPEAKQAPLRPQGFVRKSAPKSDWVPQVLLEDVAQMALFDGGTTPQAGSFVIVFREELLGELQCRIEITKKGELEATFVAADGQTADLLRSHTQRLEAQLSGHGLRHVTLKVAEG